MPGPTADVFLPSGGAVAKGGGATIAGIPRTWFFVGVAVAAVIVFVVLRNRSSSSSAAGTVPTVNGDGSAVPATSSTDSGAGAGGGPPPVASPDFSGLISGYSELVSELLGAGATFPQNANTAQHVVSGQANGQLPAFGYDASTYGSLTPSQLAYASSVGNPITYFVPGFSTDAHGQVVTQQDYNRQLNTPLNEIQGTGAVPNYSPGGAARAV